MKTNEDAFSLKTVVYKVQMEKVRNIMSLSNKETLRE
jgi:hypothetical protein